MMKVFLRGMLGVMVFWIQAQAFGQLEPEFETRVVLQVKDGGAPVVGADASLGFLHLRKNSDVWLKGKTDGAGRFGGSGKVVGSLRFSVRKEGYYSLSKRRTLIRMDVDERKVKDVTFPLVMRKRTSPEPLYAKRVSLEVPSGDSAFEFDLKEGDWLPPKGGGIRADLRFEIGREFKGYKVKGRRLEELRQYSKKSSEANGEVWSEAAFMKTMGKWSSQLEIKVPDEKEGIAVVDTDYVPYCELRMPHLAYEKGYVPSRVWTKENGGPEKDVGERGYFLRTRVKLNEAGEVQSAHYSKIIEEIRIDPRGRIEFAYVFNPTVNDRNLEFDSSANLFGKLPMEEQVRSP